MIYRIICLHGKSFCEIADAALRRTEHIARKYLGPLVEYVERLVEAGGEPITIILTFPGVPRETLERAVGKELAARIIDAHQDGYAGFTIGTIAIAITDDEIEAGKVAAEEFLHALFSMATLAVRSAACRLAAERGRVCSEFDDWLAEELMVKWMLIEAGVLTHEEYMEEYERYAETYRAETGEEPPFAPEDAKKLLAEVSRLVNELWGEYSISL